MSDNTTAATPLAYAEGGDLLREGESFIADEKVEKGKPKVFTLPCGYLTNEAVHKEVSIREMILMDENVLNDPDYQKDNAAISELLARVIKRLGPIENNDTAGERSEFPQEPSMQMRSAVKLLYLGDIQYASLIMRMLSLGPEYHVQVTCPGCGKRRPHVVDLSTIKKKEMPHPENEIVEIELPSGTVVRAIHLRGAKAGSDLNRLRQEHPRDYSTAAIAHRLSEMKRPNSDIWEKIQGRAPDRLNRMTKLDVETLRERLNDETGGIDPSVEFTCKACDTEFTEDIDLLQNTFFFPSARKKG